MLEHYLRASNVVSGQVDRWQIIVNIAPCIICALVSESVVDLCREVLAAHSQCIIQSADPDDIFLNRLLEHLHTRQCIQRDQIELLKREPVSFDRCAKLLEFVSNSEGCQTFLELCNALDVFGTVNSRALADSMRKSFEDKKAMEIWAGMEIIIRLSYVIQCGLFSRPM